MSLPYFPLFPTDFEAKTSHLTLEEDGAYNRLLRLMWMTPGCSLPDDDAWIMRRMRCDQDTFDRVVSGIIDEFCKREKGRVSNARLSRVFDESNAAHKRRVSAGARGGKAKALKEKEIGPSIAGAMSKQPEPEPEPEPDKYKIYLSGDEREKTDDKSDRAARRYAARQMDSDEGPIGPVALLPSIRGR
ncbi:MAG: YdaU family protein [Shimia sp.]|nr:YdaU family protein [Shimia sp.]